MVTDVLVRGLAQGMWEVSAVPFLSAPDEMSSPECWAQVNAFGFLWLCYCWNFQDYFSWKENKGGADHKPSLS
jgi:hypothetical protein